MNKKGGSRGQEGVFVWDSILFLISCLHGDFKISFIEADSTFFERQSEEKFWVIAMERYDDRSC